MSHYEENKVEQGETVAYTVTETSDPKTLTIEREDDLPTDDAKAGAALGAAGGLLTGVIAGSVMGPLGSVAGGAIGAIVGGVASGAAVQAIDAIDHDGSPNEADVVQRIELTESTEDPEFHTQTIHRDPPVIKP